MPRKKKRVNKVVERGVVVSFRIPKDIDDATLNMIKKAYDVHEFGKLTSAALSFYANFYSKFMPIKNEPADKHEVPVVTEPAYTPKAVSVKSYNEIDLPLAEPKTEKPTFTVTTSIEAPAIKQQESKPMKLNFKKSGKMFDNLSK